MLKLQEHLIQYGLEETLSKFKLNIKDLGHKVMFKYDQLRSSLVNPEVHEARGLVLAKDNWDIISMPFTRFFTHDDHYAAKLDLSTTVFTEKRDGTLIQVYWDYITDEWCVNTMFSECEDTFFGQSITLKTIFLDLLKKYNTSFDYFVVGTTYIFELTSQYNRVVVRYNEPELRLIGARSILSLKEIPYDKLSLISPGQIPVVETYNFSSMEECIESFQGKSFNFEGYVAFDGVNRVKIKNPAYVAVHLTKRMQDDLLDISKPEIFLDIVKQNEISEFSSAFPHAKELIEDLNTKYNLLIEKLNKAKIDIGVVSDSSAEAKKEFAKKVFSVLSENKINPGVSSLFFMFNDGKVNSVEEYLRNCDNKKLYKLL